ncbi:MAG: ChbG/HpnK family deacetylase [Actinomycetota bacterium]
MAPRGGQRGRSDRGRGHAAPPKLLIVNADDFGLTLGISEGILRAHEQGIVTSTSVLAIGPAYPKVTDRLADHPELGIGVHLAAVGEDPPLLSRSEVPSLFDRHGRLPETWSRFLARTVAGRVDPDDVRREFHAQLEAVAELGLPITHLDAHQHLHLWPPVRRVVLDLAREHAVPAVRVPRLAKASLVGVGVSVLGRRLAAEAGRAGIAHPADAIGIEVAGQLDHARLASALARLASRGAPSAELTVHPGEPDDPDRARYRWGYGWHRELEALTSDAARASVTAHGYRLGTYADLVRSPEPGPR